MAVRQLSSAHNYFAIAISNLGHTYTHLFIILYATAVLHLPQVFDLPYGELLGLSSFGLFLFGAAALPAGWLGDRWSQVGMMIIFFIGIGLGALVVGCAQHQREVFLGLTLIGLFAAIYHPVGIAWIVASARHQGMSLGINGVFGNVGSALAPIFVGLMVDFVSWRAAFLIPGVLAITTGLTVYVLWKMELVIDTQQDLVEPPPIDPRAVRRVFILLTLTMAASGLIFTGFTNIMPKLFQMGVSHELANSYTKVGILVGCVTGLSSLSSILGGYLADRYPARLIYIIFWAVQIPFLFIIAHLAGPWLLLVAFLVLSFNLAFMSAENLLVAQYTPFRWRSLAYGAKFVLALGTGGVTVWLAGHLFDTDGNFRILFILLGTSALIATVSAILLPKRSSSAS